MFFSLWFFCQVGFLNLIPKFQVPWYGEQTSNWWRRKQNTHLLALGTRLTDSRNACWHYSELVLQQNGIISTFVSIFLEAWGYLAAWYQVCYYSVGVQAGLHSEGKRRLRDTFQDLSFLGSYLLSNNCCDGYNCDKIVILMDSEFYCLSHSCHWSL